MILVTGGTGLVGSQLLLQLATRNEAVVSIKRKSSDLSFVKNVFAADPTLFNKVHWVEGDILNPPSFRRLMTGIKKVYHCAGMVSYDPADFDRMAAVNVRGTENLVKLCLEHQVEKLCYVSSVSAINRINEEEMIDENTAWETSKQNSHYAISKYQAEQIVSEAMQKGLPAIIVNPTIIVGPGNWRTGSSAMFSQVWRGLKFYPAGVAGFVDVRDVCNAMIRLMESEIRSERFIVNAENLTYKTVFNWIAEGLGKPAPSIPANRLLLGIAWRLALIKKIFSKQAPFITKETVVSGMMKVRFSNRKIQQALGMKFIPIQQSVEDTCASFFRNRNSDN